MRIGHLLGEDDQDRIAADLRALPHRLAVGIEEDAPGPGLALGEPVFARQALRGRRINLALAAGEFLGGDAAAQPRAATMAGDELVVQLLEQAGHDVALGPPAAAPDPAVDAADHVDDDIGLHAGSLAEAVRLTRWPRMHRLPSGARGSTGSTSSATCSMPWTPARTALAAATSRRWN